MSIFLRANWFKRGEFWKHPRRGSIVWNSGARFPFGPAAVFWGVLHLLSACAGCKPAEERQDVDTGGKLENPVCLTTTAKTHWPDRLWDWVWSPPGWSGSPPTCTPDGRNGLSVITSTQILPRMRSDQCYLFAIVQQHDVIVGQIVLTEVWALLRNREIAFLIGTSEGRRNQGTSSSSTCIFYKFLKNVMKYRLTWRAENVSYNQRLRHMASENQSPPRRSSLAPPPR